MNLERYEFYAQGTWHEFEFVSEGPNGSILKRVEFHPRMQIGYPFFNFAFGDWNEKAGQIDNTSITNNNDAKKVLATVATIVDLFTKQFSDVTIIAEGSTRSRTRLYQIGIVDDMKPSKLSPSMKKKMASIDEKIKRAGLPNFPPFED